MVSPCDVERPRGQGRFITINSSNLVSCPVSNLKWSCIRERRMVFTSVYSAHSSIQIVLPQTVKQILNNPQIHFILHHKFVLTHDKQTLKFCCMTTFCFWHFRHFTNHINAEKRFHDSSLFILCLFKALLTDFRSEKSFTKEVLTSRCLPPDSLFSSLSVSMCQPEHEVFSSLSLQRPQRWGVPCNTIKSRSWINRNHASTPESPVGPLFNFWLRWFRRCTSAPTGSWLNKKTAEIGWHSHQIVTLKNYSVGNVPRGPYKSTSSTAQWNEMSQKVFLETSQNVNHQFTFKIFF